MPNPQPMQLACQRHGTWLAVGEHVELDKTPEVGSAPKRSTAFNAATAKTSHMPSTAH